MGRSMQGFISSTTSRPTKRVSVLSVAEKDLLASTMEQSETPPRELTLEEAVALAILLQKNEQLVEAQELYRRVLDTAPNHPDALHYAGVLAHQQGQSDEAVALIERSLALAPGRADCYNNLGIIFQSTGKLQAAIDAYQHAIAIDPSHANAHSNLGVLLRATGKPLEAEAAYRTAIQLNPEHIDAYTNLGILLNALKRTEGSSRVLLQGDHAQTEAPGSATASGAGALRAG